jgi:hypothetical protein
MYIGLLVSQVRRPQERFSYPDAALSQAEPSAHRFSALWTRIKGAFSHRA